MSELEAAQVAPQATGSLGVDAPPSAAASKAQPSLWRLLYVWFLLGLQSFGGGTATLYLIRRTAVEQQHWLTPDEFTRDWALCLAAPGINLLCMTILVGWRVAGLAGGVIALVGLMLPSVSLTVLMTAMYADLRNLPIIQAALHGIVPATIGLGLLLTVNMAQPLLSASKRESQTNLGLSIILLIGSALAVVYWELPVVLVLCCAGVVGALMTWLHATQKKAHQQ